MDKVVLKALTKRNRFTALHQVVPAEMMDANTNSLLKWFEYYFKYYPEHEAVQTDALVSLIKLKASMERSDLEVLERIIKSLDEPISEDVLKNTTNILEELSYSGKVGALLAQFQDGDDIDITYELMNLTQSTRNRLDTISGTKWADKPILEYLEQDNEEVGLKWSIPKELGDRLRTCVLGDNYAIAAPTDKGKTSYLIALAVDFAKQARRVYPNQPLLYLVNEGTADNLMPRVYQTALQVTRLELHNRALAGTAETTYTKIVGARDAIRMVDVHGLSVHEVTRLIEQHKPYMVITDMTGRIKSNDRTKNELAQLEDVWNSLRELAAIHKFIHIGTIQVSVEGMDKLFPPLTALQNSKVGVQTTLDLCVMMGALTDPLQQNIRGISTPKNKRAKTGASSFNQIECLFAPETNTWR